VHRALLAFVAGCSYSPATSSAVPLDTAIDGVEIDGVAIDAAPACPPQFVTIPAATSRYRAITSPEAYPQAVEVCAALGPHSHLVRVDSQAEVDGVYGLVGAFVRVVGQRHINNPSTDADDTWHDLDDVTELAFLPWGNNEPTNGVGELCMSLRDEFTGTPPPKVAGADDCTTPRQFVCECE